MPSMIAKAEGLYNYVPFRENTCILNRLQAGFLTRILPRGAFPFYISNSGLKFASGDFQHLGTDTHSGATAAAFYRVPIFCIREKNFADLQSPLFFFQRAYILQSTPPPFSMQGKKLLLQIHYYADEYQNRHKADAHRYPEQPHKLPVLSGYDVL
jgi:hypothetical protein